MQTNLLTPWRKQQTGLSLIELMVGLVIGILAMLVILQMYQVFEGQKRTTTTGGDAQENGLFALTMLERDVKMAGYGLTTAQTLACTNYFTYRDTGTGPAAAIPNFSTAPITIVDGGTGSDTVILRRSTSLVGGAPASIREDMPQPSSVFKVNTTQGIVEDSLALVVQGGNCTLIEITASLPGNALGVQHAPRQSQLSETNPNYNPPANCYTGSGICVGFPTYTVGAQLFNVGNILTQTYSITPPNIVNNAPSLSLVNNTAPPILVATQIVYMKAQYGVAAPPGPGVDSQVITRWVDATDDSGGATAGNWLAPNVAEIRRIKAVRIAVVARSTQQETGVVTQTLPLWRADTRTNGENMPLNANDQLFRYKVYHTIIPIRNVMWANI